MPEQSYPKDIDALERILLEEFEKTDWKGGFEKDSEDSEDSKYDYSSSDWMRTPDLPRDTIDNRKYCKSVANQLSLPACVGNAAANSAEATCIADLVKRGVSLREAQAKVPELSRMFPWWVARNEMYPRSGNVIRGTFIRLAMDCFARHGIPAEEYWPYSIENAVRKPSVKAFRKAFKHRCDKFYHLREDDPELRVEALIQACRMRQFPNYGTPVDEAFLRHQGAEVVGRPRGKIVGGHAMMICGYSPSLKAFLSMNSWGKFWGFDGFFWISEEWVGDPDFVNCLWIPTKGFI